MRKPQGPDTDRNAGVNAMNTSLKNAISRMWLYYSGADAVTERTVLVFRCMVWWMLSCAALYMLFGGAFMYDLWWYQAYDPELALTPVPVLMREFMCGWWFICRFILSWLTPLICLLFTLKRFSADVSVAHSRTRIPFNPRR
jgi:hypothetical protein